MKPLGYSYLYELLGTKPDVVVVLGSGLGSFGDAMENTTSVRYSDIAEFPIPEVAGHDGVLTAGTIGGKSVAAFAGRFHHYAGHTPQETALPIELTAHAEGRYCIVTNAAGGLRPDLRIGDLMLITDYLVTPLSPRLPHSMQSPFRGTKPSGTWISEELEHIARMAAWEAGTALQSGVYGYLSGPSYETRAEVAFLRKAGADAVGMSTVPELLAARKHNIPVIGISCITNEIRTHSHKLSHDDVKHAAEAASARFTDMLIRLIHSLPE